MLIRCGFMLGNIIFFWNICKVKVGDFLFCLLGFSNKINAFKKSTSDEFIKTNLHYHVLVTDPTVSVTARVRLLLFPFLDGAERRFFYEITNHN